MLASIIETCSNFLCGEEVEAWPDGREAATDFDRCDGEEVEAWPDGREAATDSTGVMEKLVAVAWGPVDPGVGSALVAAGARRVTVFTRAVDVDMSAAVAVATDDATISTVVSWWMDSADDAGPLLDVVGRGTSRVAAYLVVESVPRVAVATPAVTQVTFLVKPDEVAYEDFLVRWHGSHTPLTLELHPVLGYVRNVVVRPLTQDAPPWLGIVEESFAAVEDLTDPMRYYSASSPHELGANMQRVLIDVRTFLDLDRIESYAMRETHYSD